MAQRDRKNPTPQKNTVSAHTRTTNLYKTYLEAKLNLLEILHSNLNLKLEVQSLKEQFHCLLESFSTHQERYRDGLHVHGSSSSAERVSAARDRARAVYDARRARMAARRTRVQGLSTCRKLPFSSSEDLGECVDPLPKTPRKGTVRTTEHWKQVTRTPIMGSNQTSVWEVPTTKRRTQSTTGSVDAQLARVTTDDKCESPQRSRPFSVNDLSCISTAQSSSFLRPSPTWGPLHSTMLDPYISPQKTNSKSKIKRPARSVSDETVCKSSSNIRSAAARRPSSACLKHSEFKHDSLVDLSSESRREHYKESGAHHQDIFAEQCDMLESMRQKIVDLEYQIFNRPLQLINQSKCSTCSSCSCSAYYENKENTGTYGLAVQSTPKVQGAPRAATVSVSQSGSDQSDLSDISNCSLPKRRKLCDKRNLSDSELCTSFSSNISGGVPLSPITRQFNALDLSGQVYPTIVETPMRKSFKVPSFLINFEDTVNGLLSASLVGRSPPPPSPPPSIVGASPIPPTCTPSSFLSSAVSTPLYPSTAQGSSEEEPELDPAAVISDPSSEPNSDQDKTIVPRLNSSEGDVTVRMAQVRFDISPVDSPHSEMRRQTGQTNLDPASVRDPLGLTISDLLDCTSNTNLAEVSGSGGYTSMVATCASSPDVNEFGSQTSDSSLDSCDISESMFPRNPQRARSDSSFKESDSSLNMTVRRKSRNVTPAESQNDLLAPNNSPNATNSSGSSRPTTDSNDRVEVIEFDYHKVRAQMPYRNRRYSSRPAALGKLGSPSDDSNNNKVCRGVMGPPPPPPPRTASLVGPRGAQCNQSSRINPANVKTVTDGDSGFSTQNSQYANDRAMAASHPSIYSEHTTSSQATSTRTLTKQNKRRLARRMKQFNSSMSNSSVKKRSTHSSRTSLHSFGYI